MATDNGDRRTIDEIIARQFASLNWKPGQPADWAGFAADFFPDASLYPSARPVKRQTVDEFMERVKSLAETKLRTFDEIVLGTEIHIFGNVAVALGACETTENGSERNRGVEAMLLVKDEGKWRIVAQAWDLERGANRIPARLIRG
jgi:hypothetical protein